jgi:hypothetical protein
MDVAQRRVAQELEQRQPRQQQDQEEALVGDPMPTLQELDAEVFEYPVGRLFIYARVRANRFEPIGYLGRGTYSI